MNRVSFFLLVALTCMAGSAGSSADTSRPNLLLITTDDLGTESVGIFGARTAATTPHLDQLARQGIRFHNAHVQVANCTPSRNVMWSGRYPHSNGVEGFRQNRNPDYKVLPDLLAEAGYFTAIRHKVNGSTPYYPYDWDMILDKTPDGQLLHRKDPASYGQSTATGIAAAKKAGKPFALVINIADPHIPYFGLDKHGRTVEDPYVPSRIYPPEEINVPGFLVDDPVVREELSYYYSTVRRADDALGAVLDALEESGEAGKTLVMFLSDHGMPFPFAKTQLYHHSTWTPLVFRWPGIIEPGSADTAHMVSAVDLLPTLLEATGTPLPDGLQGRSFLPLLQSRPQEGRDRVFKEYNENSAGQRAPMRAVQTSRFLYIFNPWSNGKYRMGSATLRSASFKRMQALAANDPAIAARVQLLEHRVPEELYDIASDPDCLVNLIDEPNYSSELTSLQTMLEDHLRDTGDPLLEVFAHRSDTDYRLEFMQQERVRARKNREIQQAIRDAVKSEAKPGQPAGGS